MISTIVNEKILKNLYVRRENWTHKGQYGKVLIVGGSREFTGSTALVALAALRTGADVTKIIAPKRAADTAASFSPELIAIPIDRDYLDGDDYERVRAESEWASVVCVGNGLGVGEGQRRLVNDMADKINKTLIIDADGLKVLSRNKLRQNILLTPNSNEFRILFGEMPPTDLEKRMKVVQEKAKEFGTNILLKGHVDIISDGETILLNKTNSVYMTKGGTGDVLTGVCAGILGQRGDILHSAAAAAFINGYTGRREAKTKRESLSPMDIVNGIYETITKWRHQ